MNTVSERLKNQIEDYIIWRSCNNLYNNKKSSVDITEFCKLPCFNHAEVDAINACDSDTIVIQCMAEGIRQKKNFKQYDRNKHYIIFTGGIWDKDKHDIGITSYELVYNWFWLIETLDRYMSPHRFNFYIDKTYDFNCEKPHVFCSLVGNQRPERELFVNQLINKISYDNYILRYSGEDLACPADHLDVVSFTLGEFDPYTFILPEHYHNVGATLPIKIYNSSYFNIVVETDINVNDSFFITEKTTKCLISGMPFLLVATPFFLKNLHDRGFRTYNTLWDESYDSIIDLDARIDALVELADRLKDFDWQKHKQELQSIAQHNLRNFINADKITNDFYKSFEATVKNYYERRR